MCRCKCKLSNNVFLKRCNMAMTREQVLSKLDTKFHATADAMAAAGFDWKTILALVLQVLANILTPTPPVPPTPAVQGANTCCPDEVKGHAEAMVAAATANLKTALCLQACCCKDD